MGAPYILGLAVILAVIALSLPDGNVSRVPEWNTRGTGPLPRQGIACLDLADDGTLLVGTIAPPGDPNVFVVDPNGKIRDRFTVGQRWIGQVSFGGAGLPYALCTTPEGRANDVPTVYACRDPVTPIRSGLGEAAYPQTVFHYGDHSNHSGTHLSRFADGAAIVYGNRVLWMDDGKTEARSTGQFHLSEEMVTVSMTAHRSGVVVVGCAAPASEPEKETSNLFLIRENEQKALWQRPPVRELGESPPLEKGIYGTPLLADGTHGLLPQEDRPVSAPLSIAVNAENPLSRIATADYPGWQRWIRSSATGRLQNYGTRMMPARPSVTVYDAAGTVLRRFGPEKFPVPVWVDLTFLPNNKQLLAYPHQWASRGLAGQPVLPADEDADTLWLLEVESGGVTPLSFPDAIAGVAVGDTGSIGVSCWNGRLYVITPEQFKAGELPSVKDLGGPALIHVLPSGRGFVAGTSQGEIHFTSAKGATVHEIDLNQQVEPVRKPWVEKARAQKIAEGLWQLPGGRVESDLGGQRVIQAPDGLILIEGHAGLSFEAEWAAMEAVGLDPRQVKFVLPTHMHGDHAPGAYLWRVTTGAQLVCSPEMAYSLQHHVPICTGYGLHPPVAADLVVPAGDTTLDLAGLVVKVVRVPGHTYGSLAYVFEKAGKRYAAIGDLIMPDGLLGYAGTINFSGHDVLASLRKLDKMGIDTILAGHGPTTGPERYLPAGIEVGSHAGWGKIRPEAPDPRFRLSQGNVLVVGWDMNTRSADFGDFNGDQRPDVAVVLQDGEGSVVRIYLNQGGEFGERPDHEFSLPCVSHPTRVRVRHLNEDKVPDIFVGGRSSAILFSKGVFPDYETAAFSLGDGNQARLLDLNGDQKPEVLVDAKFGSFQALVKQDGGRWGLNQVEPRIHGPYPDLWTGDLNGDQRPDLISSYGQVHLRGAGGLLSEAAAQVLPLASPGGWSFFAVGDFNGDGRQDVTLSSYAEEEASTAVYLNSGNVSRPFGDRPDTVLKLNDHPKRSLQSKPLLRDSMPVADWNGDGVDDLIVGRGQDKQVLILFGGKDGLNLDRSAVIPLDYRHYYETGLHVADFNGDGKADVAGLGYVNTGLVLGAYIYLQVD
jgi:glyoxylase-like metal-dependent hydrolase (beta-lactamase superfamily II)